MKVGDEVWYPIAYPGPDTALVRILEIKGDRALVEDLQVVKGFKFWTNLSILFRR